MDAVASLGKTVGLFQSLFASSGEATEGKAGGYKKDPKAKQVMNAILATPKGIMKMAGKGAGVAGISLSVSSVLRQSQLFTGIIGSFFQVVGGFVDVLLAPFMPYLSRVISILATKVPMVQEMATKIHQWLVENVFPIIAEWSGKLWDQLEKVWVVIKELQDWAMAIPWGDWLKTAWTEAKGLFDMVAGHITDIYGLVKPLLTDVAVVLWDFVKTTIFPIFKESYELFKVVADKILFPLVKFVVILLGYIWDYIGKPLLVVLGYLLKDVPQQIRDATDFITEIFEFTWLKDGLAAVLQFLSTMINALADFGIIGQKPFGFLEGNSSSLDEMIKILKSPTAGGKQELNISVSTTIDGLSGAPEQLKYDLMDKQSILTEKQISIRTDTNALEPNVPI